MGQIQMEHYLLMFGYNTPFTFTGLKKGESEINCVYLLWKMPVWTGPAGEGVLWR